MVYPGPDDFEGVVLVGQREEGFALDVGFCYVDAVERGGEVVEDAEEVVVVADYLGVWGGGLVGMGGGGIGGTGEVYGGLHGGHGAEEAVGWGGGLVADGWRAWSVIAAEHAGLVGLEAQR